MENIYIHHFSLKEGNEIKTVKMNALKHNNSKKDLIVYECSCKENETQTIRELDLNKAFENPFNEYIGIFTKDSDPYSSIYIVMDYLVERKNIEKSKGNKMIECYSNLINYLENKMNKKNNDDYER